MTVEGGQDGIWLVPVLRRRIEGARYWYYPGGPGNPEICRIPLEDCPVSPEIRKLIQRFSLQLQFLFVGRKQIPHGTVVGIPGILPDFPAEKIHQRAALLGKRVHTVEKFQLFPVGDGPQFIDILHKPEHIFQDIHPVNTQTEFQPELPVITDQYRLHPHLSGMAFRQKCRPVPDKVPDRSFLIPSSV